MNARRVAVLVLDLLLLAAVVGYFVWHSTRSDGDPPQPVPETKEAAQDSTTKAGRRAQAREVQRALRTLESDPGALVATASRPTVGSRARAAVPRGSKVSPKQRSWKPDGNGGGTMAVTVRAPGAKPVTYAAVMIREPDGWKVLATIPVVQP